MIKILLNIRLNFSRPFDEQLVTRRVGHEAFQTSCVEPWLLLIFISRVLLTSLIFAFIVEPYFPHGNLLRSTKNRTKTGNFLHYRTCPSMRQTRPWETITFYPWKEEDIIPFQGWRQRPLPLPFPLNWCCPSSSCGNEGILRALLNPWGSFTMSLLPLLPTLPNPSCLTTWNISALTVDRQLRQEPSLKCYIHANTFFSTIQKDMDICQQLKV